MADQTRRQTKQRKGQPADKTGSDKHKRWPRETEVRWPTTGEQTPTFDRARQRSRPNRRKMSEMQYQEERIVKEKEESDKEDRKEEEEHESR